MVLNRINSRWLIVIALLAGAGTLRFYRLGEWSFEGDELAAFAEDASLFGNDDSPTTSQVYRLPRLTPLAYVVLHSGYLLFGTDERGSRTIMAIFGTAGVVLVFLLLDDLVGRVSALATSILIAVWPEHIYHSQENRMYAVVAFFSFACMLLGARTFQRRSAWSAVMTCLAGGAIVLSHTLMGAVPALVLLALLVGSWAEGKRLSREILLVFLVTGIMLAVFFAGYLWPLLRGWNENNPYGYSVLSSIKSCVGMLGVPVVLLGVVGGLMALRRKSAQNWYWLTCGLGCIAAIVVFPLLVVHRPAYIFPMSLGVFVLAGVLIGAVFEALAKTSLATAAAWLVAASILDPRGLVSYYADGCTSSYGRFPMREAARYVETHWRPGDSVATFSTGLVRYYAPECQPVFPLSPTRPVPRLEELAGGGRRVWVVTCNETAHGLHGDFRDWLGRHGRHELTIEPSRLDHDSRCVQVFLVSREEVSR